MHPALLLLLLLLLLPHASVLHVVAASNQTNDTRCTPARCGNLSITYPFSLGGVQPLYCGYPAFQLTCDDARSAYLSRTFREHLYLVRDINYDNNSLVVSVENTFAGNKSCPLFDFNVSSSLALFPFSISDTNEELVFVNNCTLPREYKSYQLSCDPHKMKAFIIHQQGGESNLTDVPKMEAFIIHQQGGESNMTDVLKNCSSLSTVPVRGGGSASEYKKLIRDGFLLEWETLGDCSKCNHSGGECRFDEGSFRCFCPDGSPCSSRDRENPGIKIGAGIATAVLCLTILSICCILLYNRRTRKQSASLDRLIREGTPLASLRKEFSLADSPGTHIFTYEELDEATDGFSDSRELGVGGFGIVYKGTLRDGSVVAVKRLYKNSYKGKEQFQNEVDLRQLRLRHPNLVTLYGCTSQSSCRDLLLVYEFVPNGTLADHLHGAREAAQPLSWPTRLSIAVDTASALDYLHAVEPQVVHRDVKTNNILLDEGFHVKVADFGVSRLFPPDATHVSTAPQGTPGYLDPMYHQCYQLTDKSDVYSFGVVLVELISSKPAVDMNRTGGDVNLANMAVHMIQCYEIDQLVDPRLGYRSDSETKRTVDLVAEVAFRCLQPEQDVRPPISEVLDVLREAQRMEKVGCAKDDVGLLKRSSDGSPDTTMYQWMSPSTTTTSNNSS